MAVTHPKIRPLDLQPYTHEGEQYWLLQDPRQETEGQLVLPPILAHMLRYIDGRHDIPAIYQALEQDAGFPLPAGTIEKAIQQLDQAYMLDNERFQQYRQRVYGDFLAHDYRPMILAGVNYPREPEALADLFASYSGDDDASQEEAWHGRAIISPHIDYQRGGKTYAPVWARASHAIADAELVLMFATDHKGGLGSLTLTKKGYETPYGILPTDEKLVDALAAAIGEEEAYRLELNHRREHSVELSAVWLHHAAPEKANPPPMVSLLIGSFHHFVAQNQHPREDDKIEAFLNTLVAETAGKRVLCVASVDMAHVGPAFGGDYVMDEEKRTLLHESDQSLIEAMKTGDAERYYQEIAAVDDRNNVCGFSPVYLMLRYLNMRGEGAAITGRCLAYEHCPADAENDSLVSISSLLLD